MRLVSCATEGDWVSVAFEIDGKRSTQRILRSNDHGTACYRITCAMSSARERLTGQRWLHDEDFDKGRGLLPQLCA